MSYGLQLEAQAPKINCGFKQDDATAHTTQQVREWLETKFQGRIISRYASIPWPARSPDLSPLDYWFWSHCTERVTKVGQRLIEDLKITVEAIAAEMDANVVRASVHHLLRRTHICRECNGAAFQYKGT